MAPWAFKLVNRRPTTSVRAGRESSRAQADLSATTSSALACQSSTAPLDARTAARRVRVNAADVGEVSADVHGAQTLVATIARARPSKPGEKDWSTAPLVGSSATESSVRVGHRRRSVNVTERRRCAIRRETRA